MGVTRVERIMGTAISVDLRSDRVPATVVDAVFAHLRDIDARFSTYRVDSEISRLARGELEEADCRPDVRHVLAACDHLAVTSGGAFDARHQGAIGGLDPSAFVKGWAVEEAAWILDDAGAADYIVNAGGDVIARGYAAPDRRWRVGIRHPHEAHRVAAVLSVSDRAVATSGTYERGEHILDPRTGRPATGLRSMTVVGPRLGHVDAYATTAFVMGLDGLRWVAEHPDHDALAITNDDRVVRTSGMDRYLVSAAA
jgi:thiamine biosynthesis lipoprotein